MNTTKKLGRILTAITMILACAGPQLLAEIVLHGGYYRFSFPPDANLVGQTESDSSIWQSVGPAGTGITVGPGSLSVEGLASSSGNHVRLAGITGPGARITFRESFNSDTVFYSFALKVADLTGLGAKGGAFIGLAPAGGAQFPLAAAISVNAVENGYRIGLAKRATGSANDFIDIEVLDIAGDTVFVVASYTFVAGPGNDTARLWVNPPFLDGSSKDSAYITSSGGEDFENLADLTLLQQPSPAMPALTLVDEIRVGKTWAAVTPSGAAQLGSFPFTFPPDSNLVGNAEPNGEVWQATGPAGTPIKIVQGSLSVPGLAAASGNRVRLVSGNAAAGIAFPSLVSGDTVFLSFALNVANIGASGQDGIETLRVLGWADQDDWLSPVIRPAPGGYQIGLGGAAEVPSVWFAPADGSGTFKTGETVFLVVRYRARPPADNECDMWINTNPSSFGTANPPPPDLTGVPVRRDDLGLIAGVLLHPAEAPGVNFTRDVDEIRVGLTWASVTPKASALIGWSPDSNGSYGPLNVTADTILPLPPDGIIHATSVTVAAGKTLRFSKNANNTPAHLLATGRVQIDGVIDVSGQPGTATSGGVAGPGGWDGGMPPTGSFPAGDGLGPGAGIAGGGRGSSGVHQFPRDPNTGGGGNVYGGPLGSEGGSGGSGSGAGIPPSGGGGGGGSIIISAGDAITVGAQGLVIAMGGPAGDGGQNGGGGGRIRLVAPKVNGTGTLSVAGGDGFRGPAGAGWVRIDRLDRSPLTLNVPVPGYFTSPLSIGAVMKVLPDPAPQLRIKSVDGVAVAADSGPVTLIRSQDAPSSVNVVVEAGNFGSLVPAQLYVVPDNAPRSVLKATLDNRAPAANPAEHTFVATVPPNMRATLQVFAGKSLPANP